MRKGVGYVEGWVEYNWNVIVLEHDNGNTNTF